MSRRRTAQQSRELQMIRELEEQRDLLAWRKSAGEAEHARRHLQHIVANHAEAHASWCEALSNPSLKLADIAYWRSATALAQTQVTQQNKTCAALDRQADDCRHDWTTSQANLRLATEVTHQARRRLTQSEETAAVAAFEDVLSARRTTR